MPATRTRQNRVPGMQKGLLHLQQPLDYDCRSYTNITCTISMTSPRMK